ncbi:unnamed protein product, partial [Sphagnum tenellum]
KKQPINERAPSHLATAASQSSVMHFDIPTPLTFSINKAGPAQASSSLQECIRYSGRLSIEQTISFYKREMELSGWDILDISDKHEGFLYCNKPTKVCGISIRKDVRQSNTTLVTLFIKQLA